MSSYETPRGDDWEAGSDTLISSQRVTGTDVYNSAGEQLGSIDDLVIDKQSGQVRFAVMSFGGFLGIGAKYHQLPWDGLRYDEHSGGYVVNLSRDELEDAPSYERDQIDSFDYAREGNDIDDYYGRIEGFYSPEQQSRRNNGLGASQLNANNGTGYRDAETAIDADVDDDLDQPGASYSNTRR